MFITIKRNLRSVLIAVSICGGGLVVGQVMNDPARIEVYITPYYNSKGTTIDVGPFSKGLASDSEPQFVATISK